jgi:HSP90 family molecular chaperone
VPSSFSTSIYLHLKAGYYRLAEQSETLEQIVKEYADFLPVPINLNRSRTRTNVIHALWFDPTPDRESAGNLSGRTRLQWLHTLDQEERQYLHSLVRIGRWARECIVVHT